MVSTILRIVVHDDGKYEDEVHWHDHDADDEVDNANHDLSIMIVMLATMVTMPWMLS